MLSLLRRRLRKAPGSRKVQRTRLLEAMPEGAVCAEIGVWKGDFAVDIVRLTHPKKLYLIDPWAFVDDERYRQSFYGGARATGQSDMDAIYRDVTARFAPEIESGTVEICRETSQAVAERLPPASLDWVYIDGDHTYEAVARDLALYGERVKPGGWITGDDYGPGGWYDGGVMRAVDAYTDEAATEVAVFWGAQFLLKKA
jgi:methyltransferase family protein